MEKGFPRWSFPSNWEYLFHLKHCYSRKGFKKDQESSVYKSTPLKTKMEARKTEVWKMKFLFISWVKKFGFQPLFLFGFQPTYWKKTQYTYTLKFNMEPEAPRKGDFRLESPSFSGSMSSFGGDIMDLLDPHSNGDLFGPVHLFVG